MSNKNQIKVSPGRRAFNIFNIIFLSLVCLVFIVPIWNVHITSFAKDIDVMGNDYLLIPSYNFV